MSPHEVFEVQGGYKIAKFKVDEEIVVAIKTPDGIYIVSKSHQGTFAFPVTTIDEYFALQYIAPLTAIVSLSYAVQYHEDLLNEFRVTILKHFVPTVLSPVQHLYHNSVQSSRIGNWNPLLSHSNKETQFSRVCIEPSSYDKYWKNLAYRVEADADFIVMRVKPKFKKDTRALRVGIEEENHPLIFASAYDSVVINSVSPVEKIFYSPKIANPKHDESVPFRLLAEYADISAPWLEPFMLSCCVYVHGRFCRDKELELEAFKLLAGGEYSHYMRLMYDHKNVVKSRFKDYKAGNKYGSTNPEAFDFAYPVVAKQLRPVKLIVECQEAKWPEKR